MNQENERRDYEIRSLDKLDDPRFVVIKKEAIFAEGFFFVTIILEMIVAYAMCPKDMSLLTYICGLPAWFFAATCVALISWIFVLYHNAKISRDLSLEARDESEKERVTNV